MGELGRKGEADKPSRMAGVRHRILCKHKYILLIYGAGGRVRLRGGLLLELALPALCRLDALGHGAELGLELLVLLRKLEDIAGTLVDGLGGPAGGEG
jgi:hypothetical protein